MNNYFSGWYFKCQTGQETIAVIPAFHITDGRRSCSIQLITDNGAWNIPFFDREFRGSRKDLPMAVGDNLFMKKGIRLNIHTEGLDAAGRLRFGELSPIRYDIMGPFCMVPFMECRHRVISMDHTVNGKLRINGKCYRFENGSGYIEGDRGRSFPKEYAWTQCTFREGSLMLSVANIPLGPVNFTGIISVIHWRGMEYRLATYLGAKVEKIGWGTIVIRQGKYTLTARLVEKKSHPLYAPKGGSMTRIIHESASCHAFYRFQEEEKTLFAFGSDQAAFEYEYQDGV